MSIYAKSLKRLFDSGKINADKVTLAAEKGLITPAEAVMITG